MLPLPRCLHTEPVVNRLRSQSGMEGKGHSAMGDEFDLDAGSDTDFSNNNAAEPASSGMLREDITKQLQEIFGGTFSDGRADEIDSLSLMVYYIGNTQQQQAALDMLHADRSAFACKVNLPRHLARLCWPCTAASDGTPPTAVQSQQEQWAAAGAKQESRARSTSGTSKPSAPLQARHR